MGHRFSRRSLLKAAGVSAAGMGIVGRVLGAAGPQVPTAPGGARKRTLRVAHLTDIHVQPELHAGEGMERALQHAMELKPDLLVYGGDQIMDALTANLDRVKTQADLFMKVHKANVKIPTHYCFGNHDVWGWGARDKFKGEALFGKRFSMDLWGYDKPYHSFDSGGWHFVILDSIQPKEGNGYTGGLDEEQYQWLSDDLDKTAKSTPVMVVSHIPIAAICTLIGNNPFKDGAFSVSAGSMHADAHKLKELFYKHRNVKLCASGHIHLGDRVEYLGVTYVCNGAVSGGWWLGSNQEFAPAYAVIDLFDDGTFDHRLIEYGWTAKP